MRHSKVVALILGIFVSMVSVGCCMHGAHRKKDNCCAPGAKDASMSMNKGDACCAPGAAKTQGM